MAIIKPNNNTISAITALPASITTGKVLQVVRTYEPNQSSSVNTTSTSFTATGIQASITPTKSGNLIYANKGSIGGFSLLAFNNFGFGFREVSGSCLS